MHAYHRAGGRLTRVLSVPIEAARSDVELSDGLSTTFSQDHPGELRFERTLRKGVYPTGVKERTRRGKWRWNGKRLG